MYISSGYSVLYDSFSIFISNKVTIDRYNLHKQELFGALSNFKSLKGLQDQNTLRLLH